MAKSNDSWTLRARRFWEQRQRRAPKGALSGYLLDESPPELGRQRFEGEWRHARRWFKGGRCLDLGCGTGIWLKALAGVFKGAEGWDYAPAMAKASRQALKSAGIKNASAHCGQITQKKGSRVFDFIFAGGVVMYTPDKALGPLLKSLARLSKPGATLLLRESCSRETIWQRQGLQLRSGLLARGSQKPPLDYVAIYRSVNEMRRKIEEAGFKVLAVQANRHYKFSDLCEAWLRALNALLGGAVSRNPALAESAAKWIFRLRLLTLYPAYLFGKIFGWKLENHWFLCEACR